MQIKVYKDTCDIGDSVLIADNGKVSFIKGQPIAEQLVKDVLAAVWSDAEAHIALAARSKGDELADITVSKLGKDMPNALKQAANSLGAMVDAVNDAATVASNVNAITHPYRKAVATCLVSIDKWGEMKEHYATARRALDSAPPIVSLLIHTMEADRYMAAESMIRMLDVQRAVMQKLQDITASDPAYAQAAVASLLDWMGMATGCPCCGDAHDDGPAAHASPMPGNNTVN